MDKTFFTTLDARRDAFAGRCDAPAVSTDIIFHSGRVLRCDAVIEAADSYVQFDGVDRADESVPVSIVAPYHQIAAVNFVRERARMSRAGF